MVHVGHVHAGCLLSDNFLSLLLGTHEQDVATVCDGRLNSLVCLVDEGEGLLQVDDVDAVALGQDETLHLGVPTAGLVTEVNAGVQHFTHSYDGHVVSFFVPRGPPIRASPRAHSSYQFFLAAVSIHGYPFSSGPNHPGMGGPKVPYRLPRLRMPLTPRVVSDTVRNPSMRENTRAGTLQYDIVPYIPAINPPD